MINQLFKLGVLITTGRFLKPRFKGLLCVLAVWLLLWFLHSEYVSYVQLSGDTGYVLYVTVAKIVLYAISIGIYVLLVEKRLWPQPVKVPPPSATKSSQPTTGRQPKEKLEATDDGFDFLRKKKTLGTDEESQ